MDVVLDQDKLNGTNKKGEAVFNWRGQFNLDFVQYILKEFAENTSLVCDPFSGSGTVLYECAKRNISCVGMDINPSAYYMSKFFTYANLKESDRDLLLKSIRKNIEQVLIEEGLTFETFVKAIKELSSEKESSFIINMVFVASKAKNLNNSLEKEIWKAFEYIEKQFKKLPHANSKLDVFLNDVRTLANEALKNKFDLIFTSPPYINVFNYHQNYRKAVEFLGWNVLDIAQSEIGSNRKNRSNRFKTVVQYCSDMLLTINGFGNALKEKGIVILVLGKISCVRGIEFYNGAIVKDLMEEMKGFNTKKCYERKFINKFGKEIYEDIIICEKVTDLVYDAAVARKVAIKHLTQALNSAEFSKEIYNSIQKTIDEILGIEASPILNIKGCDMSEYN